MIRDLVIQLVSPLILGGAEKNRCDDPPTLRPPSLRGQLRFWSRALGGGGDEGRELEERLWGNTDSGQRVRILGAQPLSPPGQAYLFPHKESRREKTATPMIPPGEPVLIRFAVPRPEHVEPLQAVVWTWLHLGGIGRRSRRGYGAFTWEPHPGHLLDGFLGQPLNRKRDLAGPAALAAYLERGLLRAFSACGVGPQSQRTSRPNADGFALLSLDQIFVGRHLTVADRYAGDRRFHWHLERRTSVVGPTDTSTSLEWLLHGLDPGARGGPLERKQLGQPKDPRLPSPMMWRLHPCSAGGHLPVMVWSPVDYGHGVYPQIDSTRAPDLARYLTSDLGFTTSLGGGTLAS